jgi:malonyl CoA-acyl carrier protein transacylase
METGQWETKKIAFLFPGQGVLPLDVIDYYKFLSSKDIHKTKKFLVYLQDSIDEINPQANFIAQKILDHASDPAWNQTAFLQPLTYTLCTLTYELINKEKPATLLPSFVLGHSLGAFSALTAAGALPYEQGIKIVSARGKFMQEESARQNTGMCAILGLTEEKVKEICLKTNTVIALKNAPTAFVIGCSKNLFPQIENIAKQLGAKKTILLETSGAFHTKYMQGAYTRFNKLFTQYPLLTPQIPVVTNIHGTTSLDPIQLKTDVIESIINPVNWIGMMEFLKNNAVNSYIELGPGTSLSSLSRLNGVAREQVSHAKDLL